MKRFEGFEHEDIHVTNPTMSECGRFVISPEDYGFRVAQTGAGRTAWTRRISGGHIALTDLTGTTSDLGKDCDLFRLSVYSDGDRDAEVFEMLVGVPFSLEEDDTETSIQAGAPVVCPATRNVEIKLTAMVQMEYAEVIQVPATMTDVELDALVSRRYQEVSAMEFTQDGDYWERGQCDHTDADPFCSVDAVLQVVDGKFVLHDIFAEDANEESPPAPGM